MRVVCTVLSVEDSFCPKQGVQRRTNLFVVLCSVTVFPHRIFPCASKLSTVRATRYDQWSRSTSHSDRQIIFDCHTITPAKIMRVGISNLTASLVRVKFPDFTAA